MHIEKASEAMRLVAIIFHVYFNDNRDDRLIFYFNSFLGVYNFEILNLSALMHIDYLISFGLIGSFDDGGQQQQISIASLLFSAYSKIARPKTDKWAFPYNISKCSIEIIKKNVALFVRSVDLLKRLFVRISFYTWETRAHIYVAFMATFQILRVIRLTFQMFTHNLQRQRERDREKKKEPHHNNNSNNKYFSHMQQFD